MDFSDLKILVIDEESASRMLISTILENEFHSYVRSISDAGDAIEIIKRDRPDLVILDLQLPRLVGYQVLVRIRNLDDYKDLAVIPCTALSSKELIIHLNKLNITDFILKPIIKKTFLLKIRNALQEILNNKNLKYKMR